MKTRALTQNQVEILDYVRIAGPVGSSCGAANYASTLKALAKKGMVNQHFNSQGFNVYYTWTITKTGETFLSTYKELI
jgi:predicted transcriptional regulator